ncbi:MAG: transposase, partial [Candidatus Electrothrix sp. AUS1_2]|nr:transposase [Candidatus Electrothrix sp. AUS1_2]
MKEKNIKRIVRKQLNSNHPDWQRLSGKQKKKIAKEITDAVAAGRQEVDEELSVPVEELIGIEEQRVDSRIMTLQDTADFVNNFHEKVGLLKFPSPRKSWPEIRNKELRFIDELLKSRIINTLPANEGYSPQMRGVFPSRLFRAELLKAIRYPEVSCRKFCSSEYMGQERKENRRFLGLPLNTKEIIDHTQLS